MKTAIYAAEKKANSHNSHGFAFLWKDKWESLAPYNITLVNFAPFQSLERFFHEENYQPSEMVKRFIEIKSDFGPIGHGASLYSITSITKKFCENFCTPRIEGFETWDNLRRMMTERCELISFHSWGIFGELYFDKLKVKYDEGKFSISTNDPNLGIELIDELVDPDYPFIDFRFFEYDQ